MKCPECVKEGEKSNVYPEGGTTTDMYCAPWYDEKEKFHVHDMNSTTWSYSCSRGHKWNQPGPKIKCPTCGDKW